MSIVNAAVFTVKGHVYNSERRSPRRFRPGDVIRSDSLVQERTLRIARDSEIILLLGDGRYGIVSWDKMPDLVSGTMTVVENGKSITLQFREWVFPEGDGVVVLNLEETITKNLFIPFNDSHIPSKKIDLPPLSPIGDIQVLPGLNKDIEILIPKLRQQRREGDVLGEISTRARIAELAIESNPDIAKGQIGEINNIIRLYSKNM